MIYLATMSGATVLDAIDGGALGALLTPRSMQPDAERLAAWTWAADNECYTQGDSFDPDRWLDWLADLPAAGCRFATAPDVVADWPATLDEAEFYLDRIRAAGKPAAIVLQDGATPETVPWGAIDAVFVGGSTEWKISDAARELVEEGRWRGKWCHMGRVNSGERFAVAHGWGCHSVDGTFLAFGPDVNLPRLLRWASLTRASERQGRLL